MLTDTSFLADIVQNVSGDRLTVSSLIPMGSDPHSFEPTPQDARRMAECRAVVVNVVGLLPGVDGLVDGAGGPGKLLIEAGAGIPGVAEDPHCWLDPLLVVTYATNIAEGLAKLDPQGADSFRANAATYAETLRELDSWISSQVQTIPAERRLLVTNHESLGALRGPVRLRDRGHHLSYLHRRGQPVGARSLAQLVVEHQGRRRPGHLCGDRQQQWSSGAGGRRGRSQGGHRPLRALFGGGCFHLRGDDALERDQDSRGAAMNESPAAS